MRETELVKRCIRELTAAGHFVWRQNSGAVAAEHNGRKRFVRFNGARGCSDIIGVTAKPHGIMIAIECKVGANKLTPFQEQFLNAVADRGGIALVVRDNTDSMLYEIEDAIKQRRPNERSTLLH